MELDLLAGVQDKRLLRGGMTSSAVCVERGGWMTSSAVCTQFLFVYIPEFILKIFRDLLGLASNSKEENKGGIVKVIILSFFVSCVKILLPLSI